MGPYKTPWLTDDVVESSAFQSIFDMPNNNFLGLNSGYIAEAKDDRPGPVVEGEDGEMYAQDSNYTRQGWQTEKTGDTPLYYYAQSQELGDVYEGNYFNRQDNGNISVQGNYVSEETIKGEWDADQGMGYFKEANPDLDFDTYLSFIKDSSSLVNQGLNRDTDPEPFDALANQYGINTSFQNDDGDMFEFNGSNFTKTFKTEGPDYGEMLFAAGLGAIATPLVGAALPSLGAVPSAFVSGAGSSAVTQGLLTGSIDLGDALKAGVTSGALAGAGDYIQDSLTRGVTTSDLGGMLTKEGVLDKIGISADAVSTAPAKKFFDWYVDNPVTSTIQKAINPLLESDIGRTVLDKLTGAMMRGYDDEWRDKRELVTNSETGDQFYRWDGTETAEDLENFQRFTNATSGGSIPDSYVGLDKKGMWRLDERYAWSDTERDRNSFLTGILDTPIEKGGTTQLPTIAEPAGEAEDSKGKGEKDTKDGGDSDEKKEGGKNEKLDGGKDNGAGEKSTGNSAGGWFDSNGNWAGAPEGVAFLEENNLLLPENDDSTFAFQLLEAISKEQDDKVKENLIDEYRNYTGVGGLSVDDIANGDTKLPANNNLSTTIYDVITDDTVLPEKDTTKLSSGSDKTQLPPSGGGVAGLPFTPRLLSSANGDPVLWTDLVWRQNNLGYKGKGEKARAYDKNMGMLKQAMAAQALGVDFKLPKGLTDKELYEAGKLT